MGHRSLLYRSPSKFIRKSLITPRRNHLKRGGVKDMTTPQGHQYLSEKKYHDYDLIAYLFIQRRFDSATYLIVGVSISNLDAK